MQLRDHQIQINSALKAYIKGIIVSPTGSGKTVCFMEDAKRFLSAGKVILVVSPRLLLSQQLMIEFDNYLHDYDFHYREVSSQSQVFRRVGKRVKVQSQYPTTSSSEIYQTYQLSKKHNLPLILFSTYDSLDSIIDANISIDVAYFDEAHNAVRSNYFYSTKKISDKAKNCFFFTATPRYTTSKSKDVSGMNNEDVYGKIIAQVPYNYLVEKGYIVPPYLHSQKSNTCIKDMPQEQIDFDTIRENVSYYEDKFLYTSFHKILYCMKGTKNIKDLLTKTNFQNWATEKEYHVLAVDSKNGGYFDGKYMKKEKFMDLLKKLGESETTKLLVLHYEMISEGIDIKHFTGVCFIRSTANDIFITQTIGRCTRASGTWKKQGVVSIVEHEDDSGEVSELTKQIVLSLLENGVPLDSIYTETSGRGDSEEVIDDIQDIKKIMKEVELDWIHQQLLEEYRQQSVEELMLNLVSA